MNNLFLFVFVSILILICPNYCFGGEDIETAKKTNAGGKKSLQKLNGIIQTKESSNKISLECCECLCGGKEISNKEKNTHLNAKRVKRSGHGRYGGACEHCGALPYAGYTYCYNCIRLHYGTQVQPSQVQEYAQKCVHCTNVATGHNYYGHPACARHVGIGNPANNDERETESTSECTYCYNPATGQDLDGRPACSTHYDSGLGTTAGESSSSGSQTRKCVHCANEATTTDLDGYPACLNHKWSGRNRSYSCVICGSPATVFHHSNGQPVCTAHNNY